MSFKESKVVIVGCGNVGSTAAYTLINQGLCETVVLIDVNKDKAYAEALDMTHAVYFMNRNIKVIAGDYSDCRDADIVIITASAPMPKDSHDRLKMLEPSMNIMKSIVNSVMASGFNGIFLVISNPVDIMTYYVWKLSGLPKKQVIGSGTNLDSARLCYEKRMYAGNTGTVKLSYGTLQPSAANAWKMSSVTMKTVPGKRPGNPSSIRPLKQAGISSTARAIHVTALRPVLLPL